MQYADIVKCWKKKNINTVAALEQQLSNFCIVFAYNSGVIENKQITYHHTREIFENGKINNFTGDVWTIFEMENQKKCYTFLLPKIIEKASITSELIQSIHYQLCQGTYDECPWSRGERPGTYKIHDYVIGTSDQGALPEEVAGEIEELCEEIQNISDRGDNIIKTSAYIHCKFENIHPFADGNGRVGRTLMNYFMLTHNYPPLIVYNETKDAYYHALDYYDKTGDIAPFVSYMKSSLEQTWTQWPQRFKRSQIADLDLES